VAPKIRNMIKHDCFQAKKRLFQALGWMFVQDAPVLAVRHYAGKVTLLSELDLEVYVHPYDTYYLDSQFQVLNPVTFKFKRGLLRDTMHLLCPQLKHVTKFQERLTQLKCSIAWRAGRLKPNSGVLEYPSLYTSLYGLNKIHFDPRKSNGPFTMDGS